jgi:hypothetical protein
MHSITSHAEKHITSHARHHQPSRDAYNIACTASPAYCVDSSIISRPQNAREWNVVQAAKVAIFGGVDPTKNVFSWRISELPYPLENIFIVSPQHQHSSTTASLLGAATVAVTYSHL